ncbi:MAG: hypothetical protein ACYC5K_13770, partial [Saccharofermentanales bacterium]
MEDSNDKGINESGRSQDDGTPTEAEAKQHETASQPGIEVVQTDGPSPRNNEDLFIADMNKGKKRFKLAKMKRVRVPETRERNVRNFRLAIVFACVILATSIITSAVSFKLFQYYNGSGSSLQSSGTYSQNASQNPDGNSNSADSASNGVSQNADGSLSIADINFKVSPSVVFIGTTYKSTNYFGRTETASGSGSGVIITVD